MTYLVAWLPDKFRLIWLAWFIGLTIFGALGIWLGLSSYNGSQGVEALLRHALLASILSGVTCLFGFLGARYVFLTSLLGMAAGIIYLAYAAASIDGWGDLIGLLSLMMIFILSIGVGAIIQVLIYVMRRRTSS
jgi:hypothetical protein